MSETIAPDHRAIDALRRVFVDQALALDGIFMRTLMEAESQGKPPCRDERVALEAQALCRQSVKIPLALPDESSRQKKSRNRASELMESGINPHDQ